MARFLEARCLDRLHVVVAPIILGGGRSSLDLSPITRCEEALRPHTTTHVLGNEVLFDCDLSAQRRPVEVRWERLADPVDRLRQSCSLLRELVDSIGELDGHRSNSAPSAARAQIGR